jgi:hypothetical protein
MWLIGEKFVTYRMAVEGVMSIVKMEDYRVPGRENTRAYREYLAFQLASRIGLPVPHTTLRHDPRYGRMSVQRYVHGATKPDLVLLEQMATSSLGIRLALFDLLCGNHDRKADNLLQRGTDIIPVDFNTAFHLTTPGSDFDADTDVILARWFHIRGMLALTPTHRSCLLGEAQRLRARLVTAFLHACLAAIPPPFCDAAEAEQVQQFLVARRDRLPTAVAVWWDTNIAPLHGLDKEGLARAMRGHL